MSFYQVDSRQLRAKKDELMTLAQRFRQAKETLCADEITLRSMWEGAANENFHTRFIKSAGQMDAFYDVVERYINVIEYVANRYDMAEQKNLGRAN